MTNGVGWWLVASGIVLTLLGLIWLAGDNQWIGRLPGDIVIENKNSRFYFPLMTCLIISIAGSVALWLIRQFSGR